MARIEFTSIPSEISSFLTRLEMRGRWMALLWRGDPHATRVQRIGIAIFAALYLSMGAAFICLVLNDDGAHDLAEKLFVLLIAAPFAYAGVRMLRNVFLRPPSKSDQE